MHPRDGRSQGRIRDPEVESVGHAEGTGRGTGTPGAVYKVRQDLVRSEAAHPRGGGGATE